MDSTSADGRVSGQTLRRYQRPLSARGATDVAMQAWTKLGLRVSPEGNGLRRTHAMLPTPLLLADRIRVFYSACDVDLRGRVFYADLDRRFPHPVVATEAAPVLEVGDRGRFDCDGVNPSCLVRLDDGGLRLYYIGWRRVSAQTPYTLIAGVAASQDDGLSFQRAETPVLPPTAQEPFFRTAPFVWKEGARWRMLYIGGGRFFDGPGCKRLPIYSLCEARSGDGLDWTHGRTLLEPDATRGEIGFGRPVLRVGGGSGTELLISRRTLDGYRQMATPWPFAPRAAALDVLLEPGPGDWESEMTCFGSPLNVDGRELLLYNGNGFGRTGFGLAYRDLS